VVKTPLLIFHLINRSIKIRLWELIQAYSVILTAFCAWITPLLRRIGIARPAQSGSQMTESSPICICPSAQSELVACEAPSANTQIAIWFCILQLIKKDLEYAVLIMLSRVDEIFRVSRFAQGAGAGAALMNWGQALHLECRPLSTSYRGDSYLSI
jgi:hypothetical protein